MDAPGGPDSESRRFQVPSQLELDRHWPGAGLSSSHCHGNLKAAAGHGGHGAGGHGARATVSVTVLVTYPGGPGQPATDSPWRHCEPRPPGFKPECPRLPASGCPPGSAARTGPVVTVTVKPLQTLRLTGRRPGPARRGGSGCRGVRLGVRVLRLFKAWSAVASKPGPQPAKLSPAAGGAGRTLTRDDSDEVPSRGRGKKPEL
jgi:hypothetical protein